MALEALGAVGFSPCTMSGVMFAERKLASVDANFISVWHSLTIRDRRDPQTAWTVLRIAMDKEVENSPWSIVSCGLSATMAALEKAQWIRKSANQWTTRGGQNIV